MNIVLDMGTKDKAFSELDAKLLYANIQEDPQGVMVEYEMDEKAIQYVYFQLVEAFEVVKKKNQETGCYCDIIQLKE